MRKKHYIHSLSFFMTDKMYSTIKRITDEREIGFSDLMREAIEEYLQKVAATDRNQTVHSTSDTRRSPCPTDIQN